MCDVGDECVVGVEVEDCRTLLEDAGAVGSTGECEVSGGVTCL